jgi:uncharacterized protein
VNRALLEVLVCPLTRTKLVYDEKRQELVSGKAGLAFPIRDGIPVMLIEEARVLEHDREPIPFPLWGVG